jgi:hypothetical protein
VSYNSKETAVLEINTSSALGLLKEVIVDHSIAGRALERNIVVIAAANPPRKQIQSSTRERDLGRVFASGHYQVNVLPSTLNRFKWSFGSLTSSQETDFIFRRICMLARDHPMASYLRASLTEVVSAAHNAMRKFAARNIALAIQSTLNRRMEDLEAEVDERARSIVSLRDVQRVFHLFEYFLENIHDVCMEKEEQYRRSMLLAVAVVYYLKLDAESRREFVQLINSLPTEANELVDIEEALVSAMDSTMEGTEIPAGIAITRGLKENIFATSACLFSRTPLIIVGPPGTSKVSFQAAMALILPNYFVTLL